MSFKIYVTLINISLPGDEAIYERVLKVENKVCLST